MKPVKRILSAAHLQCFQRSSTHTAIITFINDLDEAVVDVKLGDVTPTDQARPVLEALDSVLVIAKETPPVDNKLSRFGNPAFRTFYDRVGSMRLDFVPEQYREELATYWQEAWGSRERVDYGSGMELNFVCFL